MLVSFTDKNNQQKLYFIDPQDKILVSYFTEEQNSRSIDKKGKKNKLQDTSGSDDGLVLIENKNLDFRVDGNEGKFTNEKQKKKFIELLELSNFAIDITPKFSSSLQVVTSSLDIDSEQLSNKGNLKTTLKDDGVLSLLAHCLETGMNPTAPTRGNIRFSKANKAISIVLGVLGGLFYIQRSRDLVTKYMVPEPIKTGSLKALSIVLQAFFVLDTVVSNVGINIVVVYRLLDLVRRHVNREGRLPDHIYEKIGVKVVNEGWKSDYNKTWYGYGFSLLMGAIASIAFIDSTEKTEVLPGFVIPEKWAQAFTGIGFIPLLMYPFMTKQYEDIHLRPQLSCVGELTPKVADHMLRVIFRGTFEEAMEAALNKKGEFPQYMLDIANKFRDDVESRGKFNGNMQAFELIAAFSRYAGQAPQSLNHRYKSYAYKLFSNALFIVPSLIGYFGVTRLFINANWFSSIAGGFILAGISNFPIFLMSAAFAYSLIDYFTNSRMSPLRRRRNTLINRLIGIAFFLCIASFPTAIETLLVTINSWTNDPVVFKDFAWPLSIAGIVGIDWFNFAANLTLVLLLAGSLKISNMSVKDSQQLYEIMNKFLEHFVKEASPATLLTFFDKMPDSVSEKYFLPAKKLTGYKFSQLITKAREGVTQNQLQDEPDSGLLNELRPGRRSRKCCSVSGCFASLWRKVTSRCRGKSDAREPLLGR